MQIIGFQMITKFRIYLEGVEPMINWKTQDKDDNRHETKIGLFYPFRRLKAIKYNRNLKKRFSSIGYPLKQCEGCGDGWAEWAIKEPNDMKYDIFVCQHCVGFYDWGMTRRRLEVTWELDNNLKVFYGDTKKEVKFKW